MAGAQKPPVPSRPDGGARPAAASHRFENLPTGGVLEPPLGSALSTVITIALVLAGGIALWQARGPLAEALDRLAFFAGSDDATEIEEPIVATESARPEARLVVPKVPAWSLVQVSEAVQAAGPRLEALIAEGRTELEEFEDLGSADEARSERALRHWQSWGRIWANRLEAIAEDFAPADSCSVHVAMAPACEKLEEVRSLVARIPDATTREDAESRFDLAAAALEAFLRPPPEPTEEEGEAETEEGEGDEAETGSGEAQA